MAIVQSFGALQTLQEPQTFWGSSGSSSLSLYGHLSAYADIYKSQPNVRICVDFLARNVAQLGVPVYRRISDTDRVRLAEHDLATWLRKPNPATTQYRLIESLVGDLGIYFNAYWLKVRYDGTNGRPAIGLVRLPPEEMTVTGELLPTGFIWTSNGKRKELDRSEVVYFNGYSPLNALMGLSPLETLRRILAEESAAADYREGLWSHGAKHEGVIQRPVTAPKWTPPQRQSFREQWQEFASSSKSGMTAVLEDGMEYKTASFSSKDSEFIQGGKLRREVCAAAYHIPQPMVGILEHATFSNIRAQHEHLYQDTLGPWLEMIQQEIEAQLLPECEDQDHVYVEFNIDAKLAGTPQDRAVSLQMAIGRPWRTVNEGRALENLPRLDDPELDTVAPQQGGPAATPGRPEPDADALAELSAPILHAHRARHRARLIKVSTEDQLALFDAQSPRWMAELSEDLTPVVGADAAWTLAVSAVRSLKPTEDAHG